MIKITIEGFEWRYQEEENSYNRTVINRVPLLELTFDESKRVNNEEAMDIVRSVLLPGIRPIVTWPDKEPIIVPAPFFPEQQS